MCSAAFTLSARVPVTNHEFTLMPPVPTLQLWVHFSFPSLMFIPSSCASGKPNVTDVPFFDQSPRVPPASLLMATPPCGDISCIYHHVSALHGDSSARSDATRCANHCVHFLSYSIVLVLWLNINSMEYAFPNILHDKSVTSGGFALLPPSLPLPPQPSHQSQLKPSGH